MLAPSHDPWLRPRRGRNSYRPARTRAIKEELDDVIDLLIGRRIKKQRVWCGYRQVDLAAAIGVSQSTLSRIERGKRQATFSEAVRIAVQLEIGLHWFIERPREERSGWERRSVLSLTPRYGDDGVVCDADDVEFDEPD